MITGNLELSEDGKTLIKVLDETVKSLVIPNSVTEIYEWAFYGCTSLECIDIPNSVTAIGGEAFHNTKWLENQPGGAVYINNILYTFKGVVDGGKVVVREGTTIIANSALKGCTSLESIDIPNSVTLIGRLAFSGCTSLESIDIPNGVTLIGRSAFSGCTSLESIDIPNSVKEIGDSAFNGCTSLESIDIPNSVTKIGDSAFFRCHSLRSIDIPKSVKTIGNHAFGQSGIKKIFIPLSVNFIGEHALCHCPLSAIEVDKDNTIYYSQDDVLYRRINGKNNILIKYPLQKSDNSFSVNESTTMLDSCAFKNAEELSEITLHNGISSLGDLHTFSGCLSLKRMELPTSITKIPQEAFYSCLSLEEVSLPNSEHYFIGKRVFGNCPSLRSIHSVAQNPDGIMIDDNAFDGFNIDECTLYIPSGTRWAYRHHPGFGKFKNIEIEKK